MLVITKLFSWLLPSLVKPNNVQQQIEKVLNVLPEKEVNSTPNSSILNQPQTANDLLLLFKCQPWSDMGYDDGNLFHSDATYTDKVSEISQKYNACCKEIEKELENEIKKAKDDVDDAGPNKIKADKARASLTSLEKKLTYLQDQRKLDHKSDNNSECHLVIELYRNGFNRGWDTYFRRTGNSN